MSGKCSRSKYRLEAPVSWDPVANGAGSTRGEMRYVGSGLPPDAENQSTMRTAAAAARFNRAPFAVDRKTLAM